MSGIKPGDPSSSERSEEQVHLKEKTEDEKERVPPIEGIPNKGIKIMRQDSNEKRQRRPSLVFKLLAEDFTEAKKPKDFESIKALKSGKEMGQIVSPREHLREDQLEPGEINLATCTDPALKEALLEFDIDGSGTITLEELHHAAYLLHESRNYGRMVTKIACSLMFLLLLTIVCITLMMLLITDLYKDTAVEGGVMKDRSTGEVLKTGSALFNLTEDGELHANDGGGIQTASASVPAALTSELPDSHWRELKHFTVQGDGGAFVTMFVLTAARYPDLNSRYGTVIKLYTFVGDLTLDGEDLTFEERVAGAFTRAGFTLQPSRRRLMGAIELLGFFNLLSAAKDAGYIDEFPMSLVSFMNTDEWAMTTVTSKNCYFHRCFEGKWIGDIGREGSEEIGQEEEQPVDTQAILGHPGYPYTDEDLKMAHLDSTREDYAPLRWFNSVGFDSGMRVYRESSTTFGYKTEKMHVTKEYAAFPDLVDHRIMSMTETFKYQTIGKEPDTRHFCDWREGSKLADSKGEGEWSAEALASITVERGPILEMAGKIPRVQEWTISKLAGEDDDGNSQGFDMYVYYEDYTKQRPFRIELWNKDPNGFRMFRSRTDYKHWDVITKSDFDFDTGFDMPVQDETVCVFLQDEYEAALGLIPYYTPPQTHGEIQDMEVYEENWLDERVWTWPEVSEETPLDSDDPLFEDLPESDPDAEDGRRRRRLESLGEADIIQVSAERREAGGVPVKKKPEFVKINEHYREGFITVYDAITGEITHEAKEPTVDDRRRAINQSSYTLATEGDELSQAYWEHRNERVKARMAKEQGNSFFVHKVLEFESEMNEAKDYAKNLITEDVAAMEDGTERRRLQSTSIDIKVCTITIAWGNFMQGSCSRSVGCCVTVSGSFRFSWHTGYPSASISIAIGVSWSYAYYAVAWLPYIIASPLASIISSFRVTGYLRIGTAWRYNSSWNYNAYMDVGIGIGFAIDCCYYWSGFWLSAYGGINARFAMDNKYGSGGARLSIELFALANGTVCVFWWCWSPSFSFRFVNTYISLTYASLTCYGSNWCTCNYSYMGTLATLFYPSCWAGWWTGRRLEDSDDYALPMSSADDQAYWEAQMTTKELFESKMSDDEHVSRKWYADLGSEITETRLKGEADIGPSRFAILVDLVSTMTHAEEFEYLLHAYGLATYEARKIIDLQQRFFNEAPPKADEMPFVEEIEVVPEAEREPLKTLKTEV